MYKGMDDSSTILDLGTSHSGYFEPEEELSVPNG
jgi:hypothetical protein